MFLWKFVTQHTSQTLADLLEYTAIGTAIYVVWKACMSAGKEGKQRTKQQQQKNTFQHIYINFSLFIFQAYRSTRLIDSNEIKFKKKEMGWGLLFCWSHNEYSKASAYGITIFTCDKLRQTDTRISKSQLACRAVLKKQIWLFLFLSIAWNKW